MSADIIKRGVQRDYDNHADDDVRYANDDNDSESDPTEARYDVAFIAIIVRLAMVGVLGDVFVLRVPIK